MKVFGIIPARYASTRFPGKPLAMIHGKTMIQRVWEQALKCRDLNSLYVATDDERIRKHVESFGGKAIMTSENHSSGTDRCLEAIAHMTETPDDRDVILNIQGDEPYLHPEQLEEICELFRDEDMYIATLAKKAENIDVIMDPNRVKVVLDADGRALYFSRQAIPFRQGVPPAEWPEGHTYYTHIGLYGYRYDTLKIITKFPPSSLEKAESLEQLRWMENGYSIIVGITAYESVAIDRPQDVENLKAPAS